MSIASVTQVKRSGLNFNAVDVDSPQFKILVTLAVCLVILFGEVGLFFIKKKTTRCVLFAFPFFLELIETKTARFVLFNFKKIPFRVQNCAQTQRLCDAYRCHLEQQLSHFPIAVTAATFRLVNT